MVFKIKNFYSFTKPSFILRFKFLHFFSGGGVKLGFWRIRRIKNLFIFNFLKKLLVLEELVL